MSLVGTRPPTVDEWDKYELHHRARLATKPGLTGMWQVSGRSNITDFEEVVKLDKQYISEWTMGLDIKILYSALDLATGIETAGNYVFILMFINDVITYIYKRKKRRTGKKHYEKENDNSLKARTFISLLFLPYFITPMVFPCFSIRAVFSNFMIIKWQSDVKNK